MAPAPIPWHHEFAGPDAEAAGLRGVSIRRRPWSGGFRGDFRMPPVPREKFWQA